MWRAPLAVARRWRTAKRVASAPAAAFAAPAPVIEFVAPLLAGTCAAPAPVTEYASSSPAAAHAAPSPVSQDMAPTLAASDAADLLRRIRSRSIQPWPTPQLQLP